MTDHLKTLRDLVAAGEKLRTGYKLHCETTRPGTPLPLPLQSAQMEIIRLGSSPQMAALLRVVEAAKVVCSFTTFEINETNAGTDAFDALDAALRDLSPEVEDA